MLLRVLCVHCKVVLLRVLCVCAARVGCRALRLLRLLLRSACVLEQQLLLLCELCVVRWLCMLCMLQLCMLCMRQLCLGGVRPAVRGGCGEGGLGLQAW